jgi:hypothetical protein
VLKALLVKIKVEAGAFGIAFGAPKGSLYASVGSLNEFTSVDLKTGKVTALISGLNGPHGILFLPNADDDNSEE